MLSIIYISFFRFDCSSVGLQCQELRLVTIRETALQRDHSEMHSVTLFNQLTPLTSDLILRQPICEFLFLKTQQFKKKRLKACL